MKILISALITFLLVLAMPHAASASFQLPKVTLCHYDTETLEVSAFAVKAHLDHGDSLGSCPEVTLTPTVTPEASVTPTVEPSITLTPTASVTPTPIVVTNTVTNNTTTEKTVEKQVPVAPPTTGRGM